MFIVTNWKDRVVDSTSGEVIQNGTPLSAAKFNHMENGINDAHIAMTLMLVAASNMGMA